MTCLLTVTHDPSGRNLMLMKKLLPFIEDVYDELYIAVSNETSNEIVEELRKSKFNVRVISKLGAAHARRESVNFGLSSKSAQSFHYCDFDRLLTWGSQYPEELKNLVSEVPGNEYLILGRTERAFLTHPEEWIATEKITNKIVSSIIQEKVDVTAGSCAFSRKSGECINLYSEAKMTDAEWPMIVLKKAKEEISYRAVEGLEYREEVNSIDREQREAEDWFARLRLSYIIAESAMKYKE